MLARWLVVSLVVLFAGAGCVSSVGDAPLVATSVEDGGSAEPAADGQNDTDSSPSPSNASEEGSTSTTPTPTPAARETPPEPPSEAPVPQPRPWSIWGVLQLGFVSAVGAGGAEDDTPVAGMTPSESDTTHCANATFLVPQGAVSMLFNISGEEVSPDGPGAGALAVVFTSPSGVMRSFSPTTTPEGEDRGDHEGTFALPEAGSWRIEVKPLGPVVSQTWSVDLVVGGESLGALPLFTAASGCN